MCGSRRTLAISNASASTHSPIEETELGEYISAISLSEERSLVRSRPSGGQNKGCSRCCESVVKGGMTSGTKKKRTCPKAGRL